MYLYLGTNWDLWEIHPAKEQKKPSRLLNKPHLRCVCDVSSVSFGGGKGYPPPPYIDIKGGHAAPSRYATSVNN